LTGVVTPAASRWPSPCGIRSAVAVAVETLQRVGRAGEALGDVRVERGVGALVDLLADRVAVDEVGHRLADGERLGRVGLGVVAPYGCVLKLKTM
jgi:hypothetical protein